MENRFDHLPHLCKAIAIIRKKDPGFIIPKAIEKDACKAESILSSADISGVDRLQLIMIYKSGYHDGGKIEGITSCDSSAHTCKFCEKMRVAAENDPSIICGKCYDIKQENYRYNVLLRHSLNLDIITAVEFTVDEMRLVPMTAIGRIDSSGETENIIHAKNMLRLIYANPISKIAYWTKNTVAVDSAIDEIGMPANMIYIESSIRINVCNKRSRYAHYTFTVYDKAHIDSAIASGAMICNGKKCMACGFSCYFGKWPVGSNIAEILR